MFETASPGPMIVYALTLYSTVVLGGRSLSVSCDVLVCSQCNGPQHEIVIH